MPKTPISVSDSDAQTLKNVSAETHSALKDDGVSVCGKRRFLDLFAKGLGYKSFSEIVVVSNDTPGDGVDFVHNLNDAAPTIAATVVTYTEGLEAKDTTFIEKAIRTACGLNPELVHHLGIQLSDRYYYSKDYGFFYSELPINDNAGALQDTWPVMHIWLKAEGVPGYMCEFQLAASVGEFDWAEFLEWSWSSECEVNLFGVPDRLVVDQRLGQALPDFQKWCDGQGVSLELVGPRDRRHNKLRNVCLSETKHEDTRAIRMMPLEEASYAMYRGLADYFFSSHPDEPTELARLELLENQRELKGFGQLTRLAGIYLDIDGDTYEAVLLWKYINRPRKDHCVRDDLVFQSGIGGGQVLGARYLAEKLAGAFETWAPGGVSPERTFVDSIRLSWPNDLNELERQYSPMIGAGLDKSELWLFDAWYFGILHFDSDNPWLALNNDRVFFPKLASHIGLLCGYAIPQGEDGYLLDIGNDTEQPEFAWLVMYPNDWISGNTLYFRVPRQELDQWRARWLSPRYLSWATHDFNTNACLRLLSTGVTKEEQNGCGHRQWDDLQALNRPLAALHEEFEIHYIITPDDLVDRLLTDKERILASVTEQTQVLFDWVTWPMAKDEARDLVCALWGMINFEMLLESMRVSKEGEDWGFGKIPGKNPSDEKRISMVDILVDASNEYVRDHAGVCQISRDGAEALLRVMLGERNGEWFLERTERGDWVCRTPNRLRFVHDLIENWRERGPLTEMVAELATLVGRYPDSPIALGEAAMAELERGNTHLADELSLRAFTLCEKIMPDDFDLFSDQVSYRYTDNWMFLDVIGYRASVLDATGQYEEALDLFASIVSMNSRDAPGEHGKPDRHDTPLVMTAKEKVAKAEARAERLRAVMLLKDKADKKSYLEAMQRAVQELDEKPTRH